MDTRNKRASAMLLSLPFRGLYPAPDSTIGQADRQTVAFFYAGILASALVFPVDDDDVFTPLAENNFYTPLAENNFYIPPK